MQDETTLDDALVLMRDLRRRCEWDAAQTHESLRPYLIEEAHEVDDALRSGNDALLREELGDLLLQVLFHSVIAEEQISELVFESLVTRVQHGRAVRRELHGRGGQQLARLLQLLLDLGRRPLRVGPVEADPRRAVLQPVGAV